MTDIKSNEKRIGQGKPGPGRPKGMPNKHTTKLKEAILAALEGAGNSIKPGGGSIAYLQQQAIENPGPFMALVGKVLPTTLTGGDGEGPVLISATPISADEWAKKYGADDSGD